MSVTSLAEKDASKLPLFHGIIKNVSILGYKNKVEWKRTEQALEINADGITTDMPVVIKVEVD